MKNPNFPFFIFFLKNHLARVVVAFALLAPSLAWGRPGGGENYGGNSSDSSSGSLLDLVLFFLDPRNWIALATALPLLVVLFLWARRLNKQKGAPVQPPTPPQSPPAAESKGP